MDRKGIIGVTVAMAILLIWQFWYAPKFAPPLPPAAQTVAGSPAPGAGATLTGAQPGASSVPASTTGSTEATVAAAAPENTAPSDWPFSPQAAPAVPENLTTVTGPAASYQFSTSGGGIRRAELAFYPVDTGSNVDLNLYGSLPIGAIGGKWGDAGNLPYAVTVHDGNTVVCDRTDPGGLEIKKVFNLPFSLNDAQGYHVSLNITFENHGATPIRSGTDGYYLYIGSAAPIHDNDLSSYTAFDWDAAGSSQHTDVNWFSALNFPLTPIVIHPERPIYTGFADKIDWASVSSQYFTTVITSQNGSPGSGVWAQRHPLPGAENTHRYSLEGAIRLPAFNLAPGQSVTQTFDLYAGPKVYGVLKHLGGGQERIITNYFSLYGMTVFRPVSVFLLDTMNLLHSWTHNYAIAIILLTLCIRGVLWPVQNKATASMRQMQAIQPRMTELKEKYHDDPTRMNTEVMKLYKEYNVNPLAGCLPMFIQIPIFFGFYRVLGTAIELRGSKFLWVHDLSQPDTVFKLLGYPVNILPLCMGLTMVMQMSLQPKTGDQAQQRMFMFLPLIFMMFCYNFASALALYWTVQNIFSITQLYVTRKRTAPVAVKTPVTKRRTR